MSPRRGAHLPDTLVLGLGGTGLSVARYLKRCGTAFAVLDTRPEPPGLPALRELDPEIPFVPGEFDAGLLTGSRRLVVSPGVSVAHEAIRAAAAAGAEILGDIELFARETKTPVIAITGSNGKSTVTSLLGDMADKAGLKVKAGANLGVPALDLLDPEAELYVLELSSFQLETTFSLRPKAAVVLNLSEDHMDRYTDFSEYKAAKARIYRHAEVALLNRGDAAVAGMMDSEWSFGLDEPCGNYAYGLRQRDGKTFLCRNEEFLLPESELRLRLRHNTANALAALALGDAAGLPRAAMLESLRSFAGLRHRTQWVAERDGVTWYNDSKGTNVGATLSALQGAQGPVVLIAGGLGKGQDFSPLKSVLQATGRALILMGQDAGLIAQAVGDVLPVERVADMRTAVQRARALACSGDTVLLSPACASFDMFSGYAERGDTFARLVKEELA